MLKWLRKYNTYILVVGGCLLMVAFLLGNSLQDLTRRGILGGKAMRVSGETISMERYGEYARDYHAVTSLLGGPNTLQAASGIENLDHWVLLAREAQGGGFVGGQRTGEAFIPDLSRAIAFRLLSERGLAMPQFVDQQAAMFEQGINDRLDRAGAESRMTPEQMYQSLATLAGIMRMRGEYYTTLRFSDRRLILDGKDNTDSVDYEFVLVPAEREMAGIAEPDAGAFQAHFDRFKDTPKGGGDFGIGYKLPKRVKVAWMEINKKAIADTITPDAVEVEKAFLRKYPTGKPPEGISADDTRRQIEADVKNELVARVLRTADEVVRAEIGRATSRLDPSGEYKKLTPDWARQRPDFVRIAAHIVARVKEAHGVTIIEPRVTIRESSWLEENDLDALEGIGAATMHRGNTTLGFADVVFLSRELSQDNDLALQLGVPYADPLSDAPGNHYYFIVLDGRKESAPDSIDEVRAEIARNIKRLAAYDKLKASAEAYKQRSIAEGLEGVAKAPEGATGEAAMALPTRSVVVTKARLSPPSSDVDSETFRNAARAAAASLDPLKDVKAIEPAQRTFVQPIDQSLTLFVGRVKGLMPMTIESFRTTQARLTGAVGREEMAGSPETDPFSLVNMQKRLNVEYLDGRKTAEEKTADAGKPGA